MISLLPTDINDLAKRIYEANFKQGFWDLPGWACLPDGTPRPEYTRLKKAEKIALSHSELSEGLEGIRKDLKSDKLEGFTSEEEEAADEFIRLMDRAGGFNLRLGEAIKAKLEYNAKRAYKHGKHF